MYIQKCNFANGQVPGIRTQLFTTLFWYGPTHALSNHHLKISPPPASKPYQVGVLGREDRARTDMLLLPKQARQPIPLLPEIFGGSKGFEPLFGR